MRVVQMNPSSPQSFEHRALPPPRPSPPPRQKTISGIKNFRTDDWILLGIIAALIFDGSDDYLLICALGYLFIMGL